MKEASEENSEVNVAITGFQNYQIAEQLLFYRCTLNSNHITLSLVFLAKLFTDDIDIGEYWMSFLNPMEEHVLIGELSGGGGFRVAISFRFSCDDSQFLYAVSSLCYNVWLMVHE